MRPDYETIESGATALQRLGERAAAVAGRVLRAAGERPRAVGGACLAAGFLIGFALPATRREDELLGASRDEVLERARAAGREVAAAGRSAGRQIVREAAETLRAAQADLASSLAAEPDLPPPPQLM